MNSSKLESPNSVAQCSNRRCEFQVYEDHDVCILHLQDPKKDKSEFQRVLERKHTQGDYSYWNIWFPIKFQFELVPIIEVMFMGCRFSHEVSFENCTFDDFVVHGCTFERAVDFSYIETSKRTSIRGCHFHSIANFKGAKFAGEAYFARNNFEYGVNFSEVDFGNNFEIYNCDLSRSLFYGSNISKVRFTSCTWGKHYLLAEELYSLQIETNKFGKLYITNKWINLALAWLVSLLRKSHFSPDRIIRLVFPNEYNRQARLRDLGGSAYIDITGGNEFYMAERTYKDLRFIYTREGEPDTAGKFFYRERVNKRKQGKLLWRFLEYVFIERLFGYGEKPLRVLFNSTLIIAGYALLYSLFGVVDEEGSIIKNIGTSLYFSVVTFSTLGYGDFHPPGCLRGLAAVEAVLGAIMIALFVVTLTRRLLR